MKQALMYVIIFVILCSLADYSIDNTFARQIDKQSPYHLALASIGAKSLESRMDSWAKMRTAPGAEDLKSCLENILVAFKLPVKKDEFILESHENTLILRYEVRFSELVYCFAIESNIDKNECYLLTSIISSDSKVVWRDYQKIYQDLLGLDWESYYLYTASIDTALSNESRKECMNVLMKNLGVAEAEIYENGVITSSAGYSETLEQDIRAVKAGKRKYNVQAALRSILDQEKTHVYIGLPLIMADY